MNNWIDQVTLIAKTSSGTDADGFETEPVETRTKVFCNSKSVRMTEFYQAQQAGVNAVMVLEINSFEYAGQTECEYDGTKYRIYRTYNVKNSEITELTLTENVQ